MEYASKGVAGAGLGLGIAGTALGILNGGGMLAGLTGTTATTEYVTKDELKMVQDLAAKDSEIALLKSENDSETKMLEVFNAMNTKANEIRAELTAFKDSQNQVNAQQGVANATMTSAIAVNATNVANIQSILNNLTKTVIPNTSVCPGWGGVTITPSATGTTIS